MTEQVQLAIIGAGPAGLAAARAAANSGVSVMLLDDQNAVGGQIYRAITQIHPTQARILGKDYCHGQSLLDVLQHDAVTYSPSSTVWQLTPEREIYFSKDGASRVLSAEHIILATGALERPMPFPGWTLPGVMTAGAGQILLKSVGLIPKSDVVLAGSGPLLFLLATQYLQAGGQVHAIVETTPATNYRHAVRYLPGALRAHHYMRKGVQLLREIKRHPIVHYKQATQLVAQGEGQLEKLMFSSHGQRHEIPCSTLLLHIGVVPNVQITRSLNLAHDWDVLQRCWRPSLGLCGETALAGITVAGDGAGIAGAMAAEHQGRIAAWHAAHTLGQLDAGICQARIEAERRKLKRELAARPFIDALYAPVAEFLNPPDETLVCRCEEVTAGQIRDYVQLGCLGPNQTKAFGRPGMGPCQGRLCGLTVSEIIAAARHQPPSEIGYYRIRPPIKPVTLGELAALHAELPNESDDAPTG